VSDHYDILVIGAGPAGVAAAVSAAGSGLRVGLIDDNPAPGGQIWRGGAAVSPSPEAAKWFAGLINSPVIRLHGWRVFDAPQNGTLRAERTGECTEFSYKKLILTTGARERFLPFPGWTLPNVMGAGALDALVKSGLPVEGKRIVVAGTGPLLLAVGAHFAKHGATVAAICEQASLGNLLRFGAGLWREPAKLLQGLGYRTKTMSSGFHTGCWPVAATGKDKLGSVTLSNGSKQWEIACDYLACGFHLVPNIELPSLLRCRIADGFVEVDELQQTSVEDIYCAGEPTGIGGVELSLLEGQIAGLAAAAKAGEAVHLAQRRKKMQWFVAELQKAFTLRPELLSLASGETLVCRCEDVPFDALRVCTSWREAKLHTRCGMGPCQGRICGAATEFLFGWSADSVRPPVFPALLSSLAHASQITEPIKETL
jgi:D-hydroxyproline dehydrogenase subunit alpha